MSAIETLAAQLNCSAADLKCLAAGVADSIKADGAVDAFINNSEIQVDMCAAYVADQVRKFDVFTTKYLSNPEARTTFQMKVFQLV